jgi:hypothetical protein
LKGGRNWLKLSIPQLWLESLFACLVKYEKQLSQTTICLCVCNFCSGMPSKGYFFHSSRLRVFDCFQALLQWVNDLNQRGEIIFWVFYDHRGVFLRLERQIYSKVQNEHDRYIGQTLWTDQKLLSLLKFNVVGTFSLPKLMKHIVGTFLLFFKSESRKYQPNLLINASRILKSLPTILIWRENQIYCLESIHKNSFLKGHFFRFLLSLAI